MKTSDFRLLKNCSPLAVAGSWLVLIVVSHNGFAGQPPVDSFEKPSELILTLSDQSLGLEQDGSTRSLDGRGNSNANLPQTGRSKIRPVDLGCGVDVNPFPDLNNSLPSRLVGECNFRYHY